MVIYPFFASSQNWKGNSTGASPMFHGQIYKAFGGSIFLQDWCCKRENRGCVKFHCSGEASAWHSWGDRQREYCCDNFQKGCPRMAGWPGKDVPKNVERWTNLLCAKHGEASAHVMSDELL
jgi:hypothetical protein